ncbi:endonuclease/exonuclease/phosphatase family protein [Poseidonibacter sp.]|uniref:endonuclease/exonuclease/phosphatase family protein n=1 Tax=Poseidonibacter sp. TaxID=2321188 RepID=UPI003C71067F
MIKLLILTFLFFNCFAKDFTISSYNVENLFDLEKNNTEYKEFIPYSKSMWNKKNFNIKINNTIRVLKDLNSDIIALQEIENKNILKKLQEKLPEYKYISFSKYNNSAVGIGFLSKVQIVDNKQIDVYFKKRVYRPILESTFKINNIEFKIFNNHWPSKRVAESFRIKYAKKLQDRLKKLPKDYDYILLGDFNSNYDENRSFKYNKKLNNTYSITGINQVLNTTYEKKYITYDDVLKIDKKVHFNLWLDLENKDRFSSKFRNQNNTPDNMILSPALLDNKKISYIHKSFKVFKADYLYKNKKINRWKMDIHKYNKVHAGYGYSDHLPIFAKFSTSKENLNPIKQILKNEENQTHNIKYLYKKAKLIQPVILKNVIVIYKNKNNAIIKEKNGKAIYIYKRAKNLKVGYSYNLQINQITNYHGLKEIVNFEIIKNNGKYQDYKSLILDANNIDIFNAEYQNNIIKNLKGKFINQKLYFNDKSIKIYAKDKALLPKNNQNISIISAHLGTYRGNPQILIHKKSDIKVEY